MTDLSQQFQNPDARLRGKPFWSWNGDLKEAELLRQIDVMQQMGMGGFFMHSRTGLATEYLGEEWFRLVNVCADEAEKRGLEAWLYDEDRWPSGTAGGMVTENHAYRSRFMTLTMVPGAEFVWRDELTAAFSCRLEGASYWDCERLYRETPAEAYHHKTVLAFHVQLSNTSSFYNGHTYVDTLNREATDYYIQLTHARYEEHCGRRLGKSIKGIFTDEPHRGPVFTGFSLNGPDRFRMTPWTDALPAAFEAKFGCDLIGRLPELFLLPEGRAVSPVKWQYMETLQQMFLENFARPLYNWCDARGMMLTGHVLHEDSLTAQAAMQGSLMRFYEFMHAPGVDVLSEGNRHFPIVKQLTSAARQLGQTWLLSELYGCTGWQMNFASHKAVGDWQALFGINLRCHHLSWYTMAGEAKRDYPASILHQSAWWQDYDFVETYFARLGLLLMQGEPCCDILVLNPVESVWCQIHAGWAEGLTPKTAEIQALESGYTELSYWLLGAHLDFDYGDEEMMGRLASVQQAEDGAPVLRVGRAAYRAVVVGRMTTMRATTVRLLADFLALGGRVLFAGEPPPYVDALPSSAPAELAALSVALPWERDALVAACQEAVQEGVEIADAETGMTLTEVSCQIRRDGKRRCLVAINMSDNQTFADVRVRLRGHGSIAELGGIEEWDCRTGARYAVPSHTEGETVEFHTRFAPSGERAFVLTPEQDAALVSRPSSPAAVGRQAAEGAYPYQLAEENVCVLDFARLKLDNGPWQEPAEVLQVDQTVRKSLGLPLRGGEMVQPWFHTKFASAPPVLARVALAFEFSVEDIPSDPVFLCMERPERWQLTLNGEPLSSAAEGWWVDTAFPRIGLPMGSVQQGGNVLTLEADFHEGIDLEAVYLVGAFGVRLDGTRRTLTRLPERLAVGDIATQGLPFYGGSLTYTVPLSPPADAARVFLTLLGFEAACVKVLSPGGSVEMLAWPPYHTEVPPDAVRAGQVQLEVVLTRRNTFGPLHQIPLRAGAYGPHNFLTTGENFSENCLLYPAGLLQAPVISWA